MDELDARRLPQPVVNPLIVKFTVGVEDIGVRFYDQVVILADLFDEVGVVQKKLNRAKIPLAPGRAVDHSFLGVVEEAGVGGQRVELGIANDAPLYGLIMLILEQTMDLPRAGAQTQQVATEISLIGDRLVGHAVKDLDGPRALGPFAGAKKRGGQNQIVGIEIAVVRKELSVPRIFLDTTWIRAELAHHQKILMKALLHEMVQIGFDGSKIMQVAARP